MFDKVAEVISNEGIEGGQAAVVVRLDRGIVIIEIRICGIPSSMRGTCGNQHRT